MTMMTLPSKKPSAVKEETEEDVEREEKEERNHHYHRQAVSNEDASPSEKEVEEFFKALRFGISSEVSMALSKKKSLALCTDSTGNSPIHWAAKSGDLQVLQLLHRNGSLLHEVAHSESQMFPIHWAASDGKISSIHFLLQHQGDINALDSNGCTPLIIATQHQQTNTVIWLAKNGADIDIADSNGDTALHWAAYKGFIELVGLLQYLRPQLTQKLDIFGQTPLHLAAMRGNLDAVNYLSRVSREDCFAKDRNGARPLDLAIQKQHIKVEFALRKVVSKTVLHEIYDIGLAKLCSARYCGLLCFGSSDLEVMVWAWRIVFYSNLIASIITVYMFSGTVLDDSYALLSLNAIAQSLWWFFFLSCLFVEPGFVKDKDYEFMQDTGMSYDSALDTIANSVGALDEDPFPAVCHTCHVRRPLRAKHDKISGRCIHKFDHFCPFVGNAVGRDNYKYFVGLLHTHVVCYTLFMMASYYYLKRVSVSWWFISYLIYSTMWLLMICGLLNYHLVLISNALTTNEQIGLHKYSYLQNAAGMVDNPFNNKDFGLNFYDALFPSQQVYFSREEYIKHERPGYYSRSGVIRVSDSPENEPLIATNEEL